MVFVSAALVLKVLMESVVLVTVKFPSRQRVVCYVCSSCAVFVVAGGGNRVGQTQTAPDLPTAHAAQAGGTRLGVDNPRHEQETATPPATQARRTRIDRLPVDSTRFFVYWWPRHFHCMSGQLPAIGQLRMSHRECNVQVQ